MTATNAGHANDPSATPGEPGATPATVHVLKHGGATYELRLICCNKVNCSKCNQNGRMRPTHGPYWYLCFTSHGRTCRVYLGKDLDTRRFRDGSGRISIAIIRAAQGKKPLPADHAHEPPPAESCAACQDPAAPRAGSLRQKLGSWIAGSKRHTYQPETDPRNRTGDA